jgi:hypothetical protein
LPIQLSIFFGILWILKSIINKLIAEKNYNKKIVLWNEEILLIFFLFACYLSMIMPIFSSELEVFQMDSRSMVPLKFGGDQIIHLAYITYGVIISILIGRHNSNSCQLEKTLKIFLLSLIFVSIWGYFEVSTYYIGLEYPYYIFNNTAAYIPSPNGSRRVLWEINLARLASVTDEPSILAQTIIPGIAIVGSYIYYGKYIFSRLADRLLIFIFIIALLLSGSTSGFIGLLVVIFGFFYISFAFNPRKFKSILFLLTLVSLTSIAINNIETINIIIDEYILNKIYTDSGVERLLSIEMAWNSFMSSPLIGVGWGSVTSMDLLIRLLSNVGIFGATIFLVLIFSMMANLWHSILRNHKVINYLSISSTISFIASISYWTIAIIAGWSFQFQISYFIIGITLASISLAKKELNC